MIAASAVTLATTSSDVRAPWIVATNTSRPRSSVPNAWAGDGGDKGWATEAKGSAGASLPASSASAISATVRPSPTAPLGVRSSIDSLVPNARVQPGIGQIRHEVGHDDRQGGQQ